MNASRRTARKFNVRSITEAGAKKEMANDPRPKTVQRRLNTLMDKVHTFLCNAHHRQIARQARKLGLLKA